MNFDAAFHKLLGHEGGYVDHPKDPGGATRWGVTERVARATGYSGHMKDFPVELAKAIYRRDYWDAVKAEQLPAEARYAVFDAAVNSGTKQAIKWLQRAVGAADDGAIGPKTLELVAQADPHKLKAAMVGDRLEFMTNLPTWPAFGKGWARRIADILET